MVIEEMTRRGFKINSRANFEAYFGAELLPAPIDGKLFRNHHNFNYLQQCFYNLEEKYERGQADFSKEQYEALSHVFYKIPF